MTKNPMIAWFLIGSLILAGVHAMLDLHRGTPDRVARRTTLLPEAVRAEAFSIARTGCATIRVDKVSNVWKITTPCAATADAAAMLRLGDALAFSPIAEELSDAELLRLGRTRSNFGLESPRLRIIAHCPSGEHALSFGDNTPANDGTYASLDEIPRVFIVPTNVFCACDLKTSDIRERRILPESAADAIALGLKDASHFAQFSRSEATWRMTSPRESIASAEAIRHFIGLLKRARASDFIDAVAATNETAIIPSSLLAGFGLDPETALTVTAMTADGVEFPISFGRDAKAGFVYALINGGTTIVTLPSELNSAARSGFTSFVSDRLFPLEKSAVNAISISDGATEYRLASSESGLWRLDTPVSATADDENVGALVDRILALTSGNLESKGMTVSLGKETGSFTVSKSALFGTSTPAILRSRRIVRIPPEQIRRLVITDADKTPITITRESADSEWIAERTTDPMVPDGDSIAKMVKTVCSLDAVRVDSINVTVDELGKRGLDRPTRTISIDSTDPKSVRRNVMIGDSADEGRYATFGSADTIFVISAETAKCLLATPVRRVSER